MTNYRGCGVYLKSRTVEVAIPYGEDSLTIELPKDNLVFDVDMASPSPLPNVREEVLRSLRNPIGMEPLDSVVGRDDKAIIMVDDLTRPTPQDQLVPLVLKELNRIGIPDSNLKIVIGLGTHRFMTEEEIEVRFGAGVVDRVEIENHPFNEPEVLEYLGETPSGVPVHINKEIRKADFSIAVGNIVPHLYAGWAGGGKMIQPGVSGEETTGMTHLNAGKYKPFGELLGNLDQEMRREIDQVALKAGLNFILNTVLNKDRGVVYVTAGDPLKAHRRGVEVAKKIYIRSIPELADIVIVSSHPADIDYWQALKGVASARRAVKEGGRIILVTPCPERISPIHSIVGDFGTAEYPKLVEMDEKRHVDDMVGLGTLFAHSQLKENVQILCLSHGLTQRDKDSLGFTQISSMEEGLEEALRDRGRDATIGVLRGSEVMVVPQ